MRIFFTRTLFLLSLCLITSACDEFKQLQNSHVTKISNTSEVENIFNEPIKSEIQVSGDKYSIVEEYESATGSICRTLQPADESARIKLYCKDKGKIHEYRYLK